MTKNKDELLGHAQDNDGIEEYDNALPDWWLGLFILTIIGSLIYVAEYHFISGRSQEGEYQGEMAAAAVMWPVEEGGALPSDTAALAAGAEVYKTTCLSCHGEKLEGKIGPSLVDDEWLHGGDAESVVKTITDGQPSKGMPAWGNILGPKKVNNVAAYILDQGKK